MKKILLSLLAFVAGTPLMAQNGLTILENPDEDYLGAACISADGRYVGGSTLYNMQAFLYDTQTGESTLFDVTDEDYGDMVLSVANNGVGAGYGDVAYTFATDGSQTPYSAFTTLQGISSDGQFLVGNYKKADTETGGAYWSYGKLVTLPEPTEDEMGFRVLGTYAKYVSADSAVIVGNIVDRYALMPAVMWRRTAEGTYELDAFSKNYSTEADSSNPYMVFSATGVSDNGEWIALWLTAADETGAIGRYNTKTQTLEAYRFDGTNEDFTTDPLTSGIANDGTLVGFTSYADARQGFIWEAGKSEPQLLAKRFPKVTEFADFDTDGNHSPSGISADGRYIVGFGTIGTEYDSYVLDVVAADKAATDGISAAVADRAPLQHYTIDGKRLAAPARGLNIVRQTDGTTLKTLNR